MARARATPRRHGRRLVQRQSWAEVVVCDRVVFMHAGRIHEMGPPAEMFGAPKTPELQQFLSALH